MIVLTKYNDNEIIVNSDLILSIESLPDTTVTMNTGRKIIVRETANEVLEKIVAFKQRIYGAKITQEGL